MAALVAEMRQKNLEVGRSPRHQFDEMALAKNTVSRSPVGRIELQNILGGCWT